MPAIGSNDKRVRYAAWRMGEAPNAWGSQRAICSDLAAIPSACDADVAVNRAAPAIPEAAHALRGCELCLTLPQALPRTRGSYWLTQKTPIIPAFSETSAPPL